MARGGKSNNANQIAEQSGMSHAADHYKSEKIMLLSDITGHRLMLYRTSPSVTAPCILGTIDLSLFFPDRMVVTTSVKSKQLLRLTISYPNTCCWPNVD